MKINVDFSALKALANKIGDLKVQFKLNPEEVEFSPLDISLSGDGVTVSADEVEVVSHLLSYKGRQILLYIKDHSYKNLYEEAIEDGSKGNRFHVAYCRTLESMMNRKRYNRYVATNNLSGKFKIGAGGRPDALAKLQVCQNCLDLLNYKDSRQSFAVKSENAKRFKLTEFFATYSSNFLFMPQYTENSKIGYTHDWPAISKALREEAGYRCEACQLDLSRHPGLCHVHHINGVKNDNSSRNLQVLCADCHRRAHEGSMHLEYRNMQLLTELRKVQGIIPQNTDWQTVLRYADPALLGELNYLHRNNYIAPEIGVKVNGTVLDIAWPDQRLGITLQKKAVPGWEIAEAGSYLSK